jgi:hypothetical protein
MGDTMSYKTLFAVMALLLLMVPAAAAVSVSVGDVALDEDKAAVRSNPLPEGSDTRLDDQDELEYVSFTIPVTVSNGTADVTDVIPDLSGFSYDPFDDEVNDSDRYKITTSLPLTITNSTKNVQIRILVPSNLDSVDANLNRMEHSLSATVQTTAGSDTSALSFYAENGLELDDVEFTVDEDTYSCDEDNGATDLDCEDELEEIPPRAALSMRIIVENIFDSDSDLDFEDVNIRIDTDDRDLDPDDDDQDVDIDAEESGTFETDFDVDNDVEDGDSFTIEIEVEVEDENGARHGFRREADIEFALPEGVVDIESFTLSDTTVCLGDTVRVDFELENKGSDNQRNVRFQIVSDGLGVDKIFTGIDLDDAEEGVSDRTYDDSFVFSVPSNKRADDYTVRGTVFYEDEDGDDTSEFRDLTLMVEDCDADTGDDDDDNQSGGSQTGGDSNIVVTPPSGNQQDNDSDTSGTVTGGATTAQPVRATVSDDDDVLFITVLTVLIIILGLVIGYLIYVLARRR